MICIFGFRTNTDYNFFTIKGQYFFDEKDKEIMLQIRRKTKAEFILTATDKCDQINTTIPLSTISETVIINEGI